MLRIPRDSNLNYLPIMYFLPHDLIAKCPTLRKLPRCFGEVAQSEELLDLIDSDPFLKEIADASAALAFPHFGFGGWKEHYTGHSPVWQLSYALSLWATLLEEETGWGLQRLFKIPSTDIIPYFEPDFIKEVMSRVVKRAISDQGWQPILDAVREMPCYEDFENWDTNVRTDFIRKWYHTRSKKVKMISLESLMDSEDDEGEIIEFSVADPRCDIAALVESEDYCQRFKARLSEKDRTILELREDGYTYKEVAEMLGYKNHSGVIKRMEAVKKEFLKYREEQK
jgi:hypothetical protein